MFRVIPAVAVHEATGAAQPASHLNRGIMEDLSISQLTSVELLNSLSH
jgi:hypothetical protein